jgi:hypothetical protein
MAKNIITIPQKMTKGEELVVIPRSLYEKFSQRDKELKEVLAKIERGRKALREGKTYVVKSPRDLLLK